MASSAKLLALAATPALFDAAPAAPSLTMQFVGKGYCDANFYAGHDGKGLRDAEACQNVCLSEPECTYAAFFKGQTCSRYNGDGCALNSNRDHITYKKTDEKTPFTPTDAMQFVGNDGYCNKHYYAGHDGKGLDSAEECQNVCLNEPECTYAAFFHGKTCSRYYGDGCALTPGNNHVLYKRTDKKTPFTPTGAMQFHGQGGCDKHKYADWDGKGLDDAEDCQNVCLSEPECTYATYAAGFFGKTCSRYYGDGCALTGDRDQITDQITYKKTDEKAPFTPTGAMQFFGDSYCNRHFYAGWDGKALDTAEDCQDLCLSEPECTYAAFLRGETCSRYYGDSCLLVPQVAGQNPHTVYKKTH